MKRYPAVQLATLTDKPPESDEWLHEIKFDGYRLLGFISGGDVRLRTRNGKDWTPKFGAMAASLAHLKAGDAVLDMEAVVLDNQGKSSFQALQAALGNGGSPNAPIVAYVFDLLALNGDDLTKLPLLDRKQKLEALLRKSKLEPTIRYSQHVSGDGGPMLAESCRMGLEGVVSKLAAAPYVTGRQRAWLKSKCGQRQEFIILGYSLARRGSRAMGALYLGYRDKGALRYAGKVGTGFSMKGASDLVKRLDPLAVQKPVLTAAETDVLTSHEWQSIRWVKPVLLCEVAFTEWTLDGRIRHPSFQGLREDKDATQVKKEKPMLAAANKPGQLVLEGVK